MRNKRGISTSCLSCIFCEHGTYAKENKADCHYFQTSMDINKQTDCDFHVDGYEYFQMVDKDKLIEFYLQEGGK